MKVENEAFLFSSVRDIKHGLELLKQHNTNILHIDKFRSFSVIM